jgi:hypothetical protein
MNQEMVFSYDENGLVQVTDPQVLDELGGGVSAQGLGCKVTNNNVAGCACSNTKAT